MSPPCRSSICPYCARLTGQAGDRKASWKEPPPRLRSSRPKPRGPAAPVPSRCRFSRRPRGAHNPGVNTERAPPSEHRACATAGARAASLSLSWDAAAGEVQGARRAVTRAGGARQQAAAAEMVAAGDCAGKREGPGGGLQSCAAQRPLRFGGRCACILSLQAARSSRELKSPFSVRLAFLSFSFLLPQIPAEGPLWTWGTPAGCRVFLVPEDLPGSSEDVSTM